MPETATNTRIANWFPGSRSALAAVFTSDADLFSRLLAATSPISTIETNMALAIRAYQHLHWFDGKLRGGFIHTHYVSILKFLRAKNERLNIGRKIWSLYQNLIGNEQVCPIDRWMLRYFGYAGEHRVDSALYDKLEGLIRYEAKVLGVTPAQRQVQIWCATRGDPTSYGDLIRRRELRKENLLNRLI